MELSPSSENWEVGMCSSNDGRACTKARARTKGRARTKVKMKVLPCLNEKQCQYLETQLKKAMDNIADHMQVQVVVNELKCAVSRAENLLKQCSYNDWLLKAVEMGDSGEYFVEVLRDLHLATDLVLWGSRRMGLEEMLSSWQRWLEAFQEEEKKLCDCREYDKSRLLKRVNEEVINSNRPKETKSLACLVLHRHDPIFSWHPDELRKYVQNYHFGLLSKNVSSGGSSVVVVKFQWMDGQFALKMPICRVQPDRDMLSNEATLLKKYSNPYIVGFVGHWRILVAQKRIPFVQPSSSSKLVPLLLMENMEVTVRQLLDKVQGGRHNDMNETGLSPTEVINLMLPVARALNYLHGKEVAHRDLKPQNIMCTLKHNKFNDPNLLDEVTVKLIDFGDAKELGAHGNSFGIAGTTGYMAPEVRNLTRTAGHTSSNDDIDLLSADIFSFGMVLGEVLTKRPPLEALGSGSPSIFWNKLTEGQRPNIPDHFPLSFITRSCWDANPRHRPEAGDICKMLFYAKLYLSDNDVFSRDELTKVFFFEDHDGVTRRTCDQDIIGGPHL